MEPSANYTFNSFSGGYLFWFHQNQDERTNLINAFFSEGETRGERLLYIGDAPGWQSYQAAADDCLPVEAMLAGNRLSYRLDEPAGTDSTIGANALIAAIQAHQAQVENAEAPGLRVYRETDPFFTEQVSVRELLEYQRLLNAFLRGKPVILLLGMDVARVDPGVLLELMLTQPRVGIRQKIYTNTHYFTPEGVSQSAGLNVSLIRKVESMFARSQVEASLLWGESTWFRRIFDSVYQFVGVMTPDGTLIEANKPALDFAGVRRSDVVGRPFWEAHWWSHDARLQVELKAAVGRAALGEFIRYEVDVRGANDQTRTIDFSIQPVHNEQGQVALLIAEGRDITAQKLVQQALHQRELLIENALDGAPIVMFIIDKDARVRLSTGKGLEMVSDVISTVIGVSLYERFEKDSELVRSFESALAGETLSTVITISGEVFDTRFVPLRDQAGEIQGVVGVGTNITRERNVEAALSTSLERFRIIFERTANGILLIDHSGQVVDSNPAFQSMIGYGAEAAKLLQLENLLLPEDAITGQQELERLLAGEQDHFQIEARLVRADGRLLWGKATVSMFSEQKDGQALIVVLVDDITERKQAEEDLRRQEALLNNVLEVLPVGVWVTNETGRIMYSNPAGKQIWSGVQYVDQDGYEEYVAWWSGTSERITRDEWALARALNRGETSMNELIDILTFDGTRRTIINWALPIKDESGKVIAAVAMNQDITERRRIEAELAEVQRRLMDNAEVERLRLAQDLHDGPLQDLYGVNFKLHELEPVVSGSGFMQQFAQASEGVQHVISTLRVLCGELRPPSLAPFGLERAIRAHAENFQRMHPELTVSLELDHDGQHLPQRHRLALYRICQEALNNVVRHAQATEVSISFSYDVEYADLVIHDNGRGFVLPTRWVENARAGHLGLVGAKERADALGGRIDIISAPGEGTTLKVSVPLGNELDPSQLAEDGEEHE